MKIRSVKITHNTLVDLRLCQRFLGCADLQATVEKLAGQRAWVIKKKNNAEKAIRKARNKACNKMHGSLDNELDAAIHRDSTKGIK